MAKLVQFSEAANLAIHSLAYLGSCEPGQHRSAAQIAQHLEVSEAHLGKVLQRLAKFDLVRSVRGPKGGFTLVREPEAVTLLEVVELVDGPLTADGCLLGRPICERRRCILVGMLDDVVHLVRQRLGKARLSDLGMDVDGRPSARGRPTKR